MAREDVNQRTQAVVNASSRPSWQLTLDELEATPWAKKFKEDSPVSYAQGLKYAQDKDLRVHIHKVDQYSDQWAISVLDGIDAQDFWMDVTPTKKEALELCRLMGWKVAR